MYELCSYILSFILYIWSEFGTSLFTPCTWRHWIDHFVLSVAMSISRDGGRWKIAGL